MNQFLLCCRGEIFLKIYQLPLINAIIRDLVFSCKTNMRLLNMAGWCVAIALALSTLYGEYKALRKDHPEPFSRAENITYGTFSRFAWSLALAWVIFACQNGFGGKFLCYEKSQQFYEVHHVFLHFEN